jgi:PEP-CTERM motif-containing protein
MSRTARSNWYRCLAHVVFLLLITASAAYAAPIFTQSVAPNSAFPSEREFDTLIADDFTLPANEVIRSVSWLGSYAFEGTAPAVDDFQIRFYADAAGSPGALLQSFAVGDTASRAAVGMVGSFITYGYTADLGGGFAAAGGTTSWLMIANNTTGDNDNWYWAVQTGPGGNVQLSLNNGSSWSDTLVAAEANFTLDNEKVSVPEPASFLLLGIGVAAAVRRKRLHR